MPDKEEIGDHEACSGPKRSGNKTMLGDICGVGETVGKSSKDYGAYHLICANVVLVSSENPRYRGRGGDCFVFSPLFAGSHATGSVATDPSPGNGMTLATAMAISGAAVNPTTGCGGEGVTRQPVLSVPMSMLNIRLGYWLANPREMKKEAGADPTPEPASLARRILLDLASADLNDLIPHCLGTDGVEDGSEVPMAKRGYLVAPIRYAPVPGSPNDERLQRSRYRWRRDAEWHRLSHDPQGDEVQERPIVLPRNPAGDPERNYTLAPGNSATGWSEGSSIARTAPLPAGGVASLF